ncbi:hypothetical protein DXB59_03040 [Ruminococcus sp. OM05-10BH]|nr:hypothetical protein DXB59_03040 [Ruminococcus sp. OM05-10BH]
MKKWKYEIMAGTLLLLVSIRINEIEIGTLVGLVCLIRGLEELYRQTEDQRFRYAWIAGIGTAMVRFTGTYEIGPWRWAGSWHSCFISLWQHWQSAPLLRMIRSRSRNQNASPYGRCCS